MLKKLQQQQKAKHTISAMSLLLFFIMKNMENPPIFH